MQTFQNLKEGVLLLLFLQKILPVQFFFPGSPLISVLRDYVRQMFQSPNKQAVKYQERNYKNEKKLT